MFGFIRKKKLFKMLNAEIKDLEGWEKRWKNAGDEWREWRCRGSIIALTHLLYDLGGKFEVGEE